ncbi:HIT family hydrolase, diadenosine tetraphosphate hydrolase [Halovivax ruber XH-70]|uniref:HIT family hydrolase, diadenosine tetraphosphate hydrolase n=1 Tax=Halovivax ruber (strain DSM 18193 / JCM 13892 / XH-70) TaxID=797302 RepID=L0IAL8_HALRX|nr:HIT family protein [Halovivax ruber]AGB14997.1 HIT family hydrolase, diadenosine tetraphosphate hydrolase [Halovivax ruber XH-70]
MEADCPFCEIAAGEGDAAEVHRTDDAVAFLDANPAVDGHTLVIPTSHCEEISIASEPTRQAVFDAVGHVSAALEQALDPDGFSVFHTSGPLVGRIDHAHVHILPRSGDDGVSLSLERDSLEGEQAETLAARIRSNS